MLEATGIFGIVRVWKNHNFECQGKKRGEGELFKVSEVRKPEFSRRK